MPRKKTTTTRKKHPLRVIPFDGGQKVDLGRGSISNLILTSTTLKGANKNMMGYSVFTPGMDTKQKIHVNAEELAHVVSGSGNMTVGSKLFPFRAGDSLHIPPGVPHGVRNDGKENVIMVFFFSSKAYPRTIDAIP
jgi:quercetin dioxygenase-like cupin family protein